MDATGRNDCRFATERLQLEPLTASDLPVLHALLTDASVRKYLFDDQVIPVGDAAAILETALGTFATHGYGLWLVYPKGQPEAAGLVGLYGFFSEPQPQLLYALLPQYQGQGMATEAARRIVQYAFDALGYAYLEASCDLPNVASVRVMERLGMGRLKEEHADDKALVWYRLDREGYRAAPREGWVN
jgi:ribosomal-protein-alanine N-acetyltransferase